MPILLLSFCHCSVNSVCCLRASTSAKHQNRTVISNCKKSLCWAISFRMAASAAASLECPTTNLATTPCPSNLQPMRHCRSQPVVCSASHT